MSKDKKPTVGEKLVRDKFFGFTGGLDSLRLNKQYSKLARVIDRKIKQAFLDGAMYGDFARSDCASDQAVYARVAKKYGVKP